MFRVGILEQGRTQTSNGMDQGQPGPLNNVTLHMESKIQHPEQDILVYGVGAQTNTFRTPGVEELSAKINYRGVLLRIFGMYSTCFLKFGCRTEVRIVFEKFPLWRCKPQQGSKKKKGLLNLGVRRCRKCKLPSKLLRMRVVTRTPPIPSKGIYVGPICGYFSSVEGTLVVPALCYFTTFFDLECLTSMKKALAWCKLMKKKWSKVNALYSQNRRRISRIIKPN